MKAHIVTYIKKDFIIINDAENPSHLLELIKQRTPVGYEYSSIMEYEYNICTVCHGSGLVAYNKNCQTCNGTGHIK
jgi:RecJ-like exonuclease